MIIKFQKKILKKKKDERISDYQKKKGHTTSGQSSRAD
jgi:hypothetical protein